MKLVKTESFFLRSHDDEVTYTVTNQYDSGIDKSVVDHGYSYFACTCSDEDKQYWKQRLHDYMPEFDPEKHASLVSQLCAVISHSFNGYISSIDMDMWFGISVQGSIWLDDEYTEYETYNIFMQCDDVTLGLMAVVDILKTIFVDE